MKITFAVHHFPPRYQGGAEWQAYRVARELLARGHDVSVIAIEHEGVLGARPSAHDELYEGVPVRRLSINVGCLPITWEYADPPIGAEVAKLVQEMGADLLHLNGGYLISGAAIEAVKALGIPVVLTLTDFWFLCPRITLVRAEGALCDVPADPMECALCLSKSKRRYRLPDQYTGGRFGRLLLSAWKHNVVQQLTRKADLIAAMAERRGYLRQVFGMADCVIAPSQFLQALYERNGMQNACVVNMRQGLGLSHWEPFQRSARTETLRIGFAGQIEAHKGVHVLVEAFKQLQGQAELIIYGDMARSPAYAKRLRQMAGDDARIHFAGLYKQVEVGQVLANLDVLVVPSVWYENSPNSILEAFAAGTPVVASNLGGMAELVQHEVSGLLFDFGNSTALAAALQRLIDEPGLLERLAGGIAPVKTVEEEVAELEAVYARVTQATARASTRSI